MLRNRLDGNSSIAAAVTSKIEDENIRAALKIICSYDKPAPDNSDIFAKLTGKHHFLLVEVSFLWLFREQPLHLHSKYQEPTL